MSPKCQVTVVGSYNIGLYFLGQRLPGPGETVIADHFCEMPGGKGSNQAMAVSRLGTATQFVARLGQDRHGDQAVSMYEREQISTRYIHRDSTTHTGIGVVMVDAGGRNQISVAPGANYRLSEKDIDEAEPAFLDSCVVGFQLENRSEVVEYAIRKVHGLGVPTLLDPAPAAKLPEDLFACIDYLKPNEHEAEILTDLPVKDVEGSMGAGRWFLDHGVKTAIITLGELGAVWVTEGEEEHLLPPRVQAIDTTGAGDIFSGAFMAAIAQRKSLRDSIEFASVAAAISVTRLGVVEAIPRLHEVLAFQKKSGAVQA